MHHYLIAAIAAGLPIAAAALPVAAPATKAANAALSAQLNWEDRQDFDFAARGFVAGPPEPVIKTADGHVVRDFRADAAFTGDAPETVNPSLWRNATLLAHHGLFKVADGIWQIRGYDLSNMTLIAGKTGWIIVDPLTVAEAAAAGLKLANDTLGARPVKAVIYTHSHADHFGGAAGVIDAADARSGKVPVVAPVGFLHHAVAENVIAGPAMARRADYMFGTLIPHAPDGHVSSGLGPVRAWGSFGLIPPNDDIHATGDERVLDGVRFVFQLTPETEAPAEMNFYLPDLKAVCMAENANGAMHNVLTPRGALVRDAKNWAAYLLEAKRKFGAADVMFTSHFWPRWGQAEIARYLTMHAEAYTYLHDQTVRMMNSGLNAAEIAEAIQLPAPLARAWFNRGNYGSLKFNARAVYQRYLGAFDGDPVNLDPIPRNDIAKRYVEAMGGAKKVMAAADKAAKTGDYRWASTLLGHLTRADPGNKPAREALAKAYEQLGYQAEAAPWRDFYLTGARELREGPQKPPAGGSNTAGVYVPVAMVLDSMATRVVPERALGTPFTLALDIKDAGERHLLSIGNGVMLHEAGVTDKADATIHITRTGFLSLIGGKAKAPELIGSGALTVEGDITAIQRFTGLFEPPAPTFPLVTPLETK
jgi:alkyl sulfatase BDS1-like metallo-beta-lactamase superfamily hydrolase